MPPNNRTLLSMVVSGLLITLSNTAYAQDPLGKGYQFEGNGKRDFPCGQPTYRTDKLPDIEWPQIKAAATAAGQQLKRARKDWSNGDTHVSAEQITSTLQWLKNGAETEIPLAVIALHGEDGCSNTQFTGYFTPRMDVKTVADAEYRYPFYRKPERWPDGAKLTRGQIDIEKKLSGQGLELAYSNSLLENYFAHVQGSVRVRYLDSQQEKTLAYGGKNGFSYQSLGRYLVQNNHISAKAISMDSIRAFFSANPDKTAELLAINNSYTFFRAVDDGPFAASGAQVTPMATAAVDPHYIPYGAVLLAEVPTIDDQNQVTGYRWQLLVAQDRGAAIKGPGHIDIYMGTGEQAREKAARLHHYGRLWWLLVE